MKRPFEATDYLALKRLGHSPAKAAEIILDAKRGDSFCRLWIENARHSYAMSLLDPSLIKDGTHPNHESRERRGDER